MTLFSTLMGQQKLLPIIQADTVTQGVEIAKAMSAAGIDLVEVVLRTEASLDVIKAIKKELPSLKVGAGTIINADILQQAIDAGSDFIITPAISPSLVVPGVSNTADILLAIEFGYSEVKLFPASLSGGAPFLKAMGSVFKGISFCPTGGVNQDNQHEFLALNNVFAVGGTWVANPEWVANAQWSKITDACKAALNS